MKTLYAHGKEEFISIKVRNFYNKNGIILKYAASYMHKENGIAERNW